MHIKHVTLYAGPEGSFQPGTEREVADQIGRALVAGNFAVELKRPETAALRAPETAVSAEQTAAAALQKIAVAKGRGKTAKSV
ncbi:MAG: hypothetical protein H6R18_1938 [Proteobacteria bacterium]|nr:hypothetical protein [Pseudomonadota bacterium]